MHDRSLNRILATISFEEAVQLAMDVVRPREEHVDRGGMYFRDHQPSCVIGEMLAARYGAQEAYDRVTRNVTNGVTTFSLEAEGILIPADPKARRFLKALQEQNDSGEQWIDALDSALEEVHESLDSVGYYHQPVEAVHPDRIDAAVQRVGELLSRVLHTTVDEKLAASAEPIPVPEVTRELASV